LTKQNIEQLRENFKAVDKKDGGKLTVKEFQAAFKKLRKLSQGSQEAIEAAIQSVDSKSSGVIDYTGFLAAALDRQAFSQEDVVWQAFRVYDEDGDGTISPSELKMLLKLDTVMAATGGATDAETVMKEIDGDGDGRINFDEFVALMRDGLKK